MVIQRHLRDQTNTWEGKAIALSSFSFLSSFSSFHKMPILPLFHAAPSQRVAVLLNVSTFNLFLHLRSFSCPSQSPPYPPPFNLLPLSPLLPHSSAPGGHHLPLHRSLFPHNQMRWKNEELWSHRQKVPVRKRKSDGCQLKTAAQSQTKVNEKSLVNKGKLMFLPVE